MLKGSIKCHYIEKSAGATYLVSRFLELIKSLWLAAAFWPDCGLRPDLFLVQVFFSFFPDSFICV